MTNAKLLAKIKAEIERERDQNRESENSYYDVNDIKNAGICRHRRYLCEELLSFISSLESEKPIISGDNLESAIDSFWNTASGYQPKFVILEVKKDGFEKIARHFYDLGCRRTAEKYDEIEYNRQRAEEHLATSGKTISVKPGDEVTINGHKFVYNKDNGYVTIVKSEESVPKDLEEAAEKYFIKVPSSEEVKKTLIEIYKPGIDAFIAGAKWQADHTPLPEDTVLFNKGVEEGKRLMMEEAVEYEVWDFSVEAYPHVNIPLDNKHYRNGDKVRVIVLQKEEKQ